MILSDSFKKAVSDFTRLPGLGPRQATRIVFFLINSNRFNLNNLRASLAYIAEVKICPRCFFIHENAGEFCDICSDPNRNPKVIAVVAKETDLISLEKTGRFQGRYFITGDLRANGVLDPAAVARLNVLKSRVISELGGAADEIILGFSPTAAGDLSADMLIRELSPFARRLTRLGRGLPTGGEIEFADPDTLSAALANRS